MKKLNCFDLVVVWGTGESFPAPVYEYKGFVFSKSSYFVANGVPHFFYSIRDKHDGERLNSARTETIDEVKQWINNRIDPNRTTDDLFYFTVSSNKRRTSIHKIYV